MTKKSDDEPRGDADTEPPPWKRHDAIVTVSSLGPRVLAFAAETPWSQPPRELEIARWMHHLHGFMRPVVFVKLPSSESTVGSPRLHYFESAICGDVPCDSYPLTSDAPGTEDLEEMRRNDYLPAEFILSLLQGLGERSATQHCKDTLAPDMVNDDYCDCLDDGSDEPLTGACAGVANVDAPPSACADSVFPASWYGDGICDCCDGADEEPGHCPDDRCRSQALLLRQESERLISHRSASTSADDEAPHVGSGWRIELHPASRASAYNAAEALVQGLLFWAPSGHSGDAHLTYDDMLAFKKLIHVTLANFPFAVIPLQPELERLLTLVEDAFQKTDLLNGSHAICSSAWRAATAGLASKWRKHAATAFAENLAGGKGSLMCGTRACAVWSLLHILTTARLAAHSTALVSNEETLDGIEGFLRRLQPWSGYSREDLEQDLKLGEHGLAQSRSSNGAGDLALAFWRWHLAVSDRAMARNNSACVHEDRRWPPSDICSSCWVPAADHNVTSVFIPKEQQVVSFLVRHFWT